MTSTLDSKSLYAGVMERAEITAEASAQGPVAKVLLSEWVRSDRRTGEAAHHPFIFTVYYKLPLDGRDAADRMAPVSLEVSTDELRALQAD